MTLRLATIVCAVGAIALFSSQLAETTACCPAGRRGMPVINADQTVILIWDPATKTQHFVRKASFKSAADDFGFLIPSPSLPELEEAGNDAFPFLQKLTEPEVIKRPRPRGGSGCGCLPESKVARQMPPADRSVTVLAEKTVAGFDAKVLEATSAKALVDWLNQNGYEFSPEVEAWAKPYVEQNWKITALKIAKPKEGQPRKDVAADALRMSFKTDRPLFPYREPDSTKSAAALNTSHRTLRIYFLADARYQGDLTPTQRWTGTVAWAGKLPAERRAELLRKLKLPESTGPAEFFLTEFEDAWPYANAPADVYFAKSEDQRSLKRPPIIEYVDTAMIPLDGSMLALGMVMGLSLIGHRRRR